MHSLPFKSRHRKASSAARRRTGSRRTASLQTQGPIVTNEQQHRLLQTPQLVSTGAQETLPVLEDSPGESPTPGGLARRLLTGSFEVIDQGVGTLPLEDFATSLQPVPHTASAAVLFQMVALGQVAEVLLQGVATGSGQFDGIHHRDAPVLSGEFHDPQ